MKSFKPKGLFRPFEGLKTLLEAQSVPLKKDDGALRSESEEPAADPATDRALFEAAMADVERITQNICAKQNSQKSNVAGPDKTDESETLLQLQELVETGKGFVVADTPEYVEGIGYHVNREVAKRLHNGEFSTATGKRMVLIIHGRGLSSPAKPILKTKVIKWLTTGRWRKWVMAFTSARLCDGGAGATYVLLRKRPATKRFKKSRK
jgi:DNA-nicking Smr family endonuclease